jgi:hypothetical protein
MFDLPALDFSGMVSAKNVDHCVISKDAARINESKVENDLLKNRVLPLTV